MTTVSETYRLSTFLPLLKPGVELEELQGYLKVDLNDPCEAIKANAFYFDNAEWAEEYLTYCHRSDTFKSRWEAALGNWEDKIVIDIGCGPGNIFATLKNKAKLLVGIDVAPNSLEMSKQFGYLPVLADASICPSNPKLQIL